MRAGRGAEGEFLPFLSLQSDLAAAAIEVIGKNCGPIWTGILFATDVTLEADCEYCDFVL